MSNKHDATSQDEQFVSECREHCSNSIANTGVGRWLERALWRIEGLARELTKRDARIERLESELECAAALLQRELPIGKVKHIGLLQVAGFLKKLVDDTRRLRMPRKAQTMRARK